MTEGLVSSVSCLGYSAKFLVKGAWWYLAGPAGKSSLGNRGSITKQAHVFAKQYGNAAICQSHNSAVTAVQFVCSVRTQLGLLTGVSVLGLVAQPVAHS